MRPVDKLTRWLDTHNATRIWGVLDEKRTVTAWLVRDKLMLSVIHENGAWRLFSQIQQGDCEEHDAVSIQSGVDEKA